MAKVCGLHRIGLKMRDLGAGAAFYQSRWQMEPLGGDESHRQFGSSRTGHADLLLYLSDNGGLDHIGLAAADEHTLGELLERVERAGHRVVNRPAESDRRGETQSATILDADGNRLDLVIPALSDGVDNDQRRRQLGHVVLWTGDIEAQERFYSLLGFKVSDRTHIGMSFLRCNRDHHSIALAHSKTGRTGLQHVAYDIGTIDDVMREFARLKTEEVECIWGVGRHGPGNNVFAYYRDPSDNIVEIYGDLEKVDEAAEFDPVFWGPEHKGDIWGLAGPPPNAFRE